jgi:hypothetical protein
MPRGRFEDASDRTLVRWALPYLLEQADMLERCHKDEFGRIRPPETRAEIKTLREWCKRAEENERPRLAAILNAPPAGEPVVSGVHEAAVEIDKLIADPLKPWPRNQA